MTETNDAAVDERLRWLAGYYHRRGFANDAADMERGANTLRTQAAEIARLREALEKIADANVVVIGGGPICDAAGGQMDWVETEVFPGPYAQLSRAALATSEKGEG